MSIFKKRIESEKKVGSQRRRGQVSFGLQSQSAGTVGVIQEERETHITQDNILFSNTEKKNVYISKVVKVSQ